MNDFLTFLLDQLAGVPEVTVKRMFGGYGLYSAGRFFAMVDQGTVYFKTNEATRKPYVDAGMTPFTYLRKGDVATLKNYYPVPVAIIEDAEALCQWAMAAAALSE